MSISRMRGRWGARLRTRFSLMSLALGVAFGTVPVALSPVVVRADAPTGISFTLQGCSGSEADVNASMLCPDADYTAGDLGKNWNELDLVPFRLTATAGGSAPATQTYQVAPVAAYMDKNVPGIDYQSAPVLNAGLSSGSCSATASDMKTFSPGLNNADVSLFRILSVTQSAGSTCVYDYYQRLALGSSNYPGSALHSDLGTVTVDGSGTVTDLASIPGVKTVPLPVGKTAAPSFAASLGATQGQSYTWTLAKQASPNPVGIANTCNPDARNQSVDVTITWQRLTSDGGITVVEKVYASNTADRALTASAVAKLFDASSTQVADDSTGDVSVPANTGNYLLATFTHSFAAGASTAYSMSVAGTWTDPITHTAIGSQSASDSAAVEAVTSNATAVVTDVSSISGSGLEYSIDSVTGPAGSLGAYVPGTLTSGSVTWTSPSLSGNGSAVLHETVAATGPMTGTGSLDDVANVAGAGGFGTGINLQVPVSAGALFDLGIHSTIPNVLQDGQTADFEYTVTDSHGATHSASIDFAAGQTSGSATLTGLAAGGYTVHQTTPAGFVAQPDQQVTLAAPVCAASVSFANAVTPATATVQKITVPAGSEAGWSFTLVGPGTPASGEKVTTTGTGAVSFSTPLQEGDYAITEGSSRQGWVQAQATGCTFTVDYPADSGRTFACQVTNVQAQVSTPTTGGPSSGVQAAKVTTPFTGADLPFSEAGLLVLLGSGLAGLGWRRGRRTAR